LILLRVIANGAVQPGCALHSVWRKHDDTDFLFSFSLTALIDAIVHSGIPSRQIR
jgi:hypothetical protein